MILGRDMPFRDTADVLVCGGGIAGVAAALAARRAGARTILLEKTISLGGLATMGVVIMYLPLCDGRGRQVIGGIAEELLRLCVTASGTERAGRNEREMTIPECWDRPASAEERAEHRFRAEFTAGAAMLALEELLVREGVQIVYDTVCADVIHDGDRITGVVVADKGGLGAYSCSALVDATGDADVCMHAGEQIVSRGANVRCGWFYYEQGGTLEVARMTEPYDRDPEVLPEGSLGFACEDGATVTAQVLGSRDLIRDRLARLSNAGTAVPVAIPQVATYRMTRRLRGNAEPSREASLEPGPDDIGMTGDWRKNGPVYHLPLGSLTGKTANLFAAGRNISVADDLWDATRAIPACAMTGQAAGVAAAISLRRLGASAVCVPGASEVRDLLRAQGAMVSQA